MIPKLPPTTMETNSKDERLDILLVLALAFEKKLGAAVGRTAERKVQHVAEKVFAMLNGEDLKTLKSRAAFLDQFSDEKRTLWQGVWLDRIRRCRRPIRLDENVDPTQIVDTLAKEPSSIQGLILKNLPAELRRQIVPFLDASFITGDNSSVHRDSSVSEDLTAVVRQQFLSNFLSLENIYNPTALDRLSAVHLERFIHDLGVRELAIACRGISSKEALAALLSRFREEDVKEIAEFIVELERVTPFWVFQADELVRKTWQPELEPEKLPGQLGLKLLGIAFIGRDEISKKYTAQKLSSRESNKWLASVGENEKEYSSATNEERGKLDKRKKMIEALANTFHRTGKL